MDQMGWDGLGEASLKHGFGVKILLKDEKR